MFNHRGFTTLLTGILLISPYQASAIVIQKIPKDSTGHYSYVVMVETATGKHCWGMPQNLDYSFLPDKPMDIEAAAKKYNWKNPTGKQKAACQALMQIVWKVHSNQDQATQPVYQITDGKDNSHNKVTDTVIDKVDTNTICGGYVNNYGVSEDRTWRMVTGKAGKHGAALCKKYN